MNISQDRNPLPPERILSIFKRVNKIDEKEEKIKNMAKERKGAAV